MLLRTAHVNATPAEISHTAAAAMLGNFRPDCTLMRDYMHVVTVFSVSIHLAGTSQSGQRTKQTHQAKQGRRGVRQGHYRFGSTKEDCQPHDEGEIGDAPRPECAQRRRLHDDQQQERPQAELEARAGGGGLGLWIAYVVFYGHRKWFAGGSRGVVSIRRFIPHVILSDDYVQPRTAVGTGHRFKVMVEVRISSNIVLG